ncbi:MAG: DUF6338 family protein [Actinomycetota bacterium]|nr:DUF6338 family protein [Actinomycetota bacterium]
MAGTFEALAVAATAVLPGALYVWGFEREVGSWGVGLSDRVFRFFGTSALIHVLLAPLTYWLWANHVRSGDAGAGRPLPLYLWALVGAYVAAPLVAGALVGRGTAAGRSWALRLTGPRPAPRSWDYFFAGEPEGWMRLRLKSGIWIGGVFEGSGSYAAGYPEAQDLLLSEMVEVDPATGEFILEAGAPILKGTRLLIRWEEIEFLEFSDA